MKNWLNGLTGRTRILAIAGLVIGSVSVLSVIGATAYNLLLPTSGAYSDFFVRALGVTPTPKPIRTSASPSPSEAQSPSDSASPSTSATSKPRTTSSPYSGYTGPTRTAGPTPTRTPTPTPVDTVPSAPTSLSANLGLDGLTVLLSWGAPTNASTSNITSYVVVYSGSDGQSGTATVGSGLTSWSITALSAGTTWSFEVYAVGAVSGNGTSSFTSL